MSRLSDANRYEMKLENGVLLGYRVPQMRELVLARLVPMITLDSARKALQDGVSPAEAAAVAEESMEERLRAFGDDYGAMQRCVALMVIDIDHEEVTLTPEETRDIPEENFAELIAIGLRAKPPGGAEGEA